MELKHYDYIQKVLDDAVNSGSVAGGTVSILFGNDEVYKNHFGYADIENRVKPDDNTIFRLFSMTKPITAIACLMLIERGILDYNDCVSQYLEGFKNQTVWNWNSKQAEPLTQPVTIRDLLTMTSGLTYPADWSETCLRTAVLFNENTKLIKQGGGMSTVEFCNRLGQIPLVCKPSQSWIYGTSADVLGAIIERVSGKSFGQYLKDEVFTPLDMNDTGFYIPEEKYSRLAQVYYYDDQDQKLKVYDGINLCISDYKKPPKFESGGAGMVSTVKDYQKFIKMILNGGIYNGNRIIGKRTIELMRTPALKPSQMDSLTGSNSGYNYGCLVRVLQDRQLAGTNASLGEFGWDGWTGNYFSIDPVENISIMYFIQKCGAGFSDVARKIRAITYSSLD